VGNKIGVKKAIDDGVVELLEVGNNIPKKEAGGSGAGDKGKGVANDGPFASHFESIEETGGSWDHGDVLSGFLHGDCGSFLFADRGLGFGG